LIAKFGFGTIVILVAFYLPDSKLPFAAALENGPVELLPDNDAAAPVAGFHVVPVIA
jgi:hypothetical protein